MLNAQNSHFTIHIQRTELLLVIRLAVLNSLTGPLPERTKEGTNGLLNYAICPCEHWEVFIHTLGKVQKFGKRCYNSKRNDLQPMEFSGFSKYSPLLSSQSSSRLSHLEREREREREFIFSFSRPGCCGFSPLVYFLELWPN